LCDGRGIKLKGYRTFQLTLVRAGILCCKIE
jgi:hypothetical protein